MGKIVHLLIVALFLSSAPASSAQDMQSLSDEKAASLLKDAEKIFDSGDPERAMQILRYVSRNAPKHLLTHLILGKLLLAQADLAGALRELKLAAIAQPDSAAAHFALGTAYLCDYKLSQAIDHLERAVQLDPNRAPYHYKLSRAYAEQDGSSRKLIQHLLSSEKLDPLHYMTRFDLGVHFANSGDTDKATAEFRVATTLKPQAIGPKLWLARLQEQTDPRAAKKLLQEVLQTDQNNSVGLEEMIFAMARLDDWSMAADAASRLVALQPKRVENHALLGWCEMRKGEFTDAEEAFENALAIDSRNPHVLNLYGLCLLELGRGVEAENTFKEAAANGADQIALVNLANLYAQTDKCGQAIKQAEALASRKLPPLLVSSIALINAECGKSADAEAISRHQLKADPDDTVALLATAISDQSAGKFEPAKTTLHRILELQPQNVFAMCSLAVVLAESGQNKEAGELAQQIIQIAPGNSHVKHMLGISIGKQGNWYGAAFMLTEALAKHPRDARLRSDLGHALEMKGDLDGAAHSYQQSLRLDKTLLAPQIGMARIAAKNDQLPSALSQIEQLIKVSPQDQEILALHADILYRLGKLDESEKSCKQVLEKHPENLAASRVMGRISFDRRQWSAAINFLREYTKQSNGSPDDWYCLASALEKTGDLQDSRTALKAALDKYPDNQRLRSLLQSISNRLLKHTAVSGY